MTKKDKRELLRALTRYEKKGIKLYKKISGGFFGNTYDYKTVHSMDEAVDLNNNGWHFERYDEVNGNISLNTYRVLKAMLE